VAGAVIEAELSACCRYTTALRDIMQSSCGKPGSLPNKESFVFFSPGLLPLAARDDTHTL